LGGDYDCGDEPEEEESEKDALDEGSESEEDVDPEVEAEILGGIKIPNNDDLNFEENNDG